MSFKAELEEFPLNATHKEACQDNLFVRPEAELFEAYLKEIADELMNLTTFFNSLKEDIALTLPDSHTHDNFG